MNKGMIKVDWNNIDNMSEEEISYYLYLEGKSLMTISKIRGVTQSIIQDHIIAQKMKNRHVGNIKSSEDMVKLFESIPKDDKLVILRGMNDSFRRELIAYIRKNYVEMPLEHKDLCIWIIGEIKAVECLDILVRASVHKSTQVRRMAVSAIGKLENEKGEMALIRALDDKNVQVQLYAIKS